MKTLQVETDIPSYAINYLVNGDTDGLNKTDRGIIDNWISSSKQYYQSLDDNKLISLDIIPLNNGEFFTWSPEFGLPCMSQACMIMLVYEG